METQSEKRRVALGSKLLDRATLDVRFPLHYATLQGDAERVCFLLGVPAPNGQHSAPRRLGKGNKMRADDEDDLGRTALHVAAAFGHKDICDILLDLDSNLVHSKAERMQGVYPLHLACAGGWERDSFLSDEDFYASLQSGPISPRGAAKDVSPSHDDCVQAEMTENQKRRQAVVTALLERGADATARNDAGTSPLHLAAGCGDLECARKLIEYGGDVNCANSAGRTPLFSAVSNGQREMVAYLLNCEADATIVTRSGVGLLHAAAMCSTTHPDIIDWLVAGGATLHARKSDGKTPLMVATEALLQASVQHLTSDAPYWHEDQEFWPDVDPEDKKYSADGRDLWSLRRASSIVAGIDVEAIKAKFGISQEAMAQAKSQLTRPSPQDSGDGSGSANVSHTSSRPSRLPSLKRTLSRSGSFTASQYV